MLGNNTTFPPGQRSICHIMWCQLILVFLVSAVSAEHFQAWETDTEYEYNVRGRTLAAIYGLADQYTGIVLRARLTVRPKSEDTLEAKVWRAQFAQIHTKLPDGWKSKIPDSMLDLKQFPISEKVFEIKMRHGVIRDIIVDKDVPTWEVNVLKSIVSQFQVDTQGENLMTSRYNQEPEENHFNAMYKTMEDSVGGKCEVLYDITSLPEFVALSRPELVPLPDLRGEGEFIDIMKTKNYSNCEQRMSYQFGVTGWNRFERRINDNVRFMSRSSVSRVVITGDLKMFTIQSSVMTNKVVSSPQLHDNQKGMVGSRVNVTLVKMGPVSTGPWSTPANPESTGNLVYSFNSPFAGPGENRRAPSFDLRNSEERLNRYSQKRPEDHDVDGRESDSSKSMNSLESDEDHSYYQPKPTLYEAPSLPLLPFFVGYQGKSIDTSTDFDVVMSSKSLASQIGSDLQNPNSITDEQTLDKFTILARLIRTMSAQQISEAEREVYQSDNEIDPHNESQSVRRNTWVAFRDAVAHAGTGPALVTIKNWIKEKKIEGFEAATVVGALSKTARTPTPEYMETFFELATMPETTSQEVLYSTAMITFAELIRFSQVNPESVHNHYPVHSFGRLFPKDNPAIFRDYIPYMADQLKQSLEKKDAAKAHAFIRALGNVAHPKILAIFEPYLEGKIPTSTFQRTLMVFSMNNLASLRPRLARGIFYKIYQNTAEAYQVRCAAVFFLMSTNPPEIMLQRMAEFTNYDHSKHVNAAVTSSIVSSSKLVTRDAQDIATKARNVRSLLNKKSYGYEYSKNYYFDNVADEISNAYQTHAAYIGSDDSFIPQAFYAGFKSLYGDIRAPKLQLAGMVSSVKELYREFSKQFNFHNDEPRGNKQSNQFSPENIAKLLKIEGEDDEDLEGTFWMNTQSHNTFMSFDKQRLQRIPEVLGKAATYLKDGRSFSMAYLECVELSLSFPMESGFPFLYVLKLPAYHKLSGSAKSESASNTMAGSMDLRLMFSTQVQGRLGFITPFENRYYMAGVNKNFHAYAPIHAEFNFDKSAKSYKLKLKPIEQNEKYKLLHYSVAPFTSRHNIFNLSPVMKDKETHEIRNPEGWNSKTEYGSRTRGFMIEIKSTAQFPNKNNWDWDLLGHVAFPFAEKKTRAFKTEMTFIPNPSSEQSVVLSGAFETYHDDTTKYDESSSKSSPKGKAPTVKSKEINDLERRHDFIKQAAEGIAAADVFAIDFGVELPGQEPIQWFMTTAFANSKVDEKSRNLAYWRFTDADVQREIESCIGMESRSPRSSISPINEESSSKSRWFDVDLRIGTTCEKGFKVQINGKQEQTDAYRELFNKMPVVLQCMREMKRRATYMPTCQAANVKSWTMDKSYLTITFDPANPSNQTDFADKLYDLSQYFPSAKMTFKKGTSTDDNTVKVSMDLVDLENKSKFELESSNVHLIAEDVDTGSFATLATNTHPEFLLSDHLGMEWYNDISHKHMCVVDYDSATTFDKTTYPVHLGRCWHVAMTTYPKYNKYNKVTESINEDADFSVVVRDAPHNRKDVKFILGKHELEFTWVDSKIRIGHNGKVLDLSEKRSYRQKNGEEYFDFELFQRDDGSVRLISSKYDFDATYDGQRVWIKASKKYRKDVRGLCGSYDGEPANDFISPRNCLLSNSEQFVASYAITSNECQGPALENARKANEADCIRDSVRLGNVVSDREAGRFKSGKYNWGFHNIKNSGDTSQNSDRPMHCMIKRTKYFEEADQFCFSLRPMPTCATTCKPAVMKVKVMPFYCMPKDEAAQKIVDRIKQGANPDFSQKIPSKKTSFEMPVHCHVE